MLGGVSLLLTLRTIIIYINGKVLAYVGLIIDASINTFLIDLHNANKRLSGFDAWTIYWTEMG